LLKQWRKISERILFKNERWSYKIDDFIIEPNFRGDYHYIHTNGATMVVPLNSNNEILITKQFRYLMNDESWEFPCGAIEENLSPIDNAMKELREETGFSANKIIPAGFFTPFTGAADTKCYLFLAYDLFHAPLPKDQTEDFEINFVDKIQLDNMITSNVIWDGLTLAAWSLIKNKI